MKIGTLFLINGILAIGHGLGLIFLPSMLLAIYQVPSFAGGRIAGPAVRRATPVHRDRRLVRARSS
jgi:hypothetical protein